MHIFSHFQSNCLDWDLAILTSDLLSCVSKLGCVRNTVTKFKMVCLLRVKTIEINREVSGAKSWPAILERVTYANKLSTLNRQVSNQQIESLTDHCWIRVGAHMWLHAPYRHDIFGLGWVRYMCSQAQHSGGVADGDMVLDFKGLKKSIYIK